MTPKPPVTVQYDLGNLERDHPVLLAEYFLFPFLVRTSASPGSTVNIDVGTRTAGTRGKPHRTTWQLKVPATTDPAKVHKCQASVAAKVVTENAAILVAAAQLASLNLAFEQVTLAGDRGDYWLVDSAGQNAGLCEVSGTTAQSRSSLYQEKRLQVLRNPTASACYVTVTNFQELEGNFCRVR